MRSFGDFNLLKKKRPLKVDLLMPSSSQYEVIHHFARKFYEAFIRQGVSCRLLSGDERVYATLNNPPDFTLGFNGALKMEDGSLFCDHIKVPHVACLIDPPFRFLELTKSPYVIITCDDQSGCAFLKKRRFDSTLFMPHAVEKELMPDPTLNRVYDVVFLGTCIDAEGRRKRWRKQFPKNLVNMMEDAAEATLSDDKTSFISILEEKLDPEEYQTIYEEVELYVKGRDRLDLIRAFSEQEIHLFGGSLDEVGWKEKFKNKLNLHIHPPVSYKEALIIMKQSKIVLNSSIKNKLGGHERIFSALASGAGIVTNDNLLMRKYFAESEILLFNRKNLQELNDRVKELLAHEDQRIEMADKGRELVMKGHTWDHRLNTLLEDLGMKLLSGKHS